MKGQASKIIVIMGPTASGKSGVALELAKKFDGEIISADSRQIYKTMDIGTGKVSKDATEKAQAGEGFYCEGIKHHLIDVAEPMEDFNISHFKTLANEAIEEILAKGKIPIICGGTAFWIDAITKNISIPEVAPNFELRKILEKQSLEELFSQLEKIDPERAKNIDSKNKVRLVRAIEICNELGTVPKHETRNAQYEFLEIAISIEKEQLNAKIKSRLEQRLKEPASTRGNDRSSTRGGGMIAEVQNLHKKGVSYEWMERIGLEYRWIARFLQDQITENEMREKLYFDIIHYAKRQMTWLKKNKNIIWQSNYQDIEKEVAKFLAQ